MEIYGHYARKKHLPHRIVLGEAMLSQGFKAPKTIFKSYQLAYNHGIGVWGSGSFNSAYFGDDDVLYGNGWFIEYEENGNWYRAG